MILIVIVIIIIFIFLLKRLNNDNNKYEKFYPANCTEISPNNLICYQQDNYPYDYFPYSSPRRIFKKFRGYKLYKH